MAYIEPCCCSRQLPELLKRGKFAFFQTGGDITVAKMMAAVSSLAGGDGHRMTLVMPEVDVMLLREIRRYFERGWTLELHLLTRENQRQMVAEELGEHVGKTVYAADPMVIDGLLAFEHAQGDGSSVIIQGAMLAEVDFSFSMYAGYYGSDTDIIDGALKPIRSKLKLKGSRGDEPAES